MEGERLEVNLTNSADCFVAIPSALASTFYAVRDISLRRLGGTGANERVISGAPRHLPPSASSGLIEPQIAVALSLWHGVG